MYRVLVVDDDVAVRYMLKRYKAGSPLALYWPGSFRRQGSIKKT